MMFTVSSIISSRLLYIIFSNSARKSKNRFTDSGYIHSFTKNLILTPLTVNINRFSAKM